MELMQTVQTKRNKVSNMGGKRLNFVNTICTGTIRLKYLDETYSAQREKHNGISMCV